MSSIATGPQSKDDTKVIDETTVDHEHQLGDSSPVTFHGVDGGASINQTRRLLTPRRAQFLILGGLIGTAVWTGVGYQLNTSGSLGLWLGMMIWAVLAIIPTTWALTELGTYMPVKGTIYALIARYVDPAAAFGLGWIAWYGSAVFIAVEYTAIAILFNFWTELNPGIWIAGCVVLSTLSNSFGTAIFGEVEFVMASFKLITIVGLVLATFILMLGGNPHHDRFGFRNFEEPVLVQEYVAEGNWGRFLAIWSAVIYGAFAIGGPDLMSSMLGEIQNPRRNYPRVARQVYLRLFLFYGLGLLCIGILCSSEDPNLLAGIQFSSGTNISPWIVGIKNLGIPVLPHLLNVVFITSAWSCGNMAIYSSSRIMYALALEHKAPAILLRCTKGGTPYYSVALSSLVSCLAFMVCADNAVVVFQWLASLFACATMLNFLLMNVTFIRFRAGLAAQGRKLDDLPFVAPLQPYASYVAMGMLTLCLLTNGWTAFVSNGLHVQTFVTGYLGILVLVVLFVGYKLWHQTKFVGASKMDLDSGLDCIAAYERRHGYDQQVVLTRWRKFVDAFY